MNQEYGSYSDDSELVVIDHPLPVGHGQPTHVHHGRICLVKKTADSITLEPMANPEPGRPLVGHSESRSYVRTDEVDAKGRAIFR